MLFLAESKERLSNQSTIRQNSLRYNLCNKTQQDATTRSILGRVGSSASWYFAFILFSYNATNHAAVLTEEGIAVKILKCQEI